MYLECRVSPDGMDLHADSALSRFCSTRNTPLNYGWLCPMIECMLCLQHGYYTLVLTYVYGCTTLSIVLLAYVIDLMQGQLWQCTYFLNICRILTDLVYNAPIAEVGFMAWEYRQPFHTLSILRRVGITKYHFNDSQHLEPSFTDEGGCIVTETSKLTLRLVRTPNDRNQHLVGHWPP